MLMLAVAAAGTMMSGTLPDLEPGEADARRLLLLLL